MKLNVLLFVEIYFLAFVYCARYKWRYTNQITHIGNCKQINNYTIVANEIDLRVGTDGDTFIYANFTIMEDIESIQVNNCGN